MFKKSCVEKHKNLDTLSKRIIILFHDVHWSPGDNIDAVARHVSIA